MENPRMISPTNSPALITSHRYRGLLLPPLVRNGKAARLQVAHQHATTPQERRALEAEYDRLFPQDRKNPAGKMDDVKTSLTGRL